MSKNQKNQFLEPTLIQSSESFWKLRKENGF